MILWKSDETIRLYKEAVNQIIEFARYKQDFEALIPYLYVFDEIPSEEKERIIEHFVMGVWNYKDRKRRGLQKKSKEKLKNAINKYQEALRELHNSDVVDEVIFRNGDVYTYDGYDDFDDDFDIETYLWNLPKTFKENYIANIEALKELEKLEELEFAYLSLGNKAFTLDAIEEVSELQDYIKREFKIINPYLFYGYPINKNSIKEALYSLAKRYNIPNYKMKQLIDEI